MFLKTFRKEMGNDMRKLGYKMPRNMLEIGFVVNQIAFWCYWGLVIGLSLGLVIDCSQGHKWAAHITISAFEGCFLLVFIILFCNLWNALKDSKLQIIIYWINAFGTLAAQVDIYTDLCFISIAYVTDDAHFFGHISLVSLIISSLPKFYSFVLVMRVACKGEPRVTDFYKFCQYHESSLFGEVFQKLMTPAVAFKTKIVTGAFKFLLEDVPQLVIQLLYLTGGYCTEAGGANEIILTSIVFGISMGFISFVKIFIDYCTNRGFKKIPIIYIQDLKKGDRIDFDFSLFDDEENIIREVFELMLKKPAQYKYLRFENTQSKINQLEKKLNEMLETTQSLEVLDLSSFLIDDVFLDQFLKGLNANLTLRTLILKSGNKSQNRLNSLAPTLISHPAMTNFIFYTPGKITSRMLTQSKIKFTHRNLKELPKFSIKTQA